MRLARGTYMRNAALLVCIMSSWVGTAMACATNETEPNDTPDTAAPLLMGDCVAGQLSGDDQDAFVPQFNGDAAQLVLTGEGAGLLQADIFLLQRNDAGDITDADRVASVSTPQGGGQARVPVSLEDGDYIIGLSRAGGRVSYTLAIQAPPANEAAALSHEGTGDGRVEWTLDETGAENLWRIVLDGSTAEPPHLVLARTDGDRIARRRADEWGRVDLSCYDLEPGDHTLKVETSYSDKAPWRLSVFAMGKRRPEREREPNDTASTAQTLDQTSFVQGRLSDNSDVDQYLLDLETGARKGLRLRGVGLSQLELCVSSENGDSECRSGRRRVAFDAVKSVSGAPLLVSVKHDSEEALDYQLSVRDPQGAALRALAEPNSARADASILPANGKAEGKLTGREYDAFILETEQPGTWRLNVTASENLREFTYDGGRYGQLTSRGGGRQATLDSLALPAGRHFFSMRGANENKEGRYVVEVTRLGDISNDRELEPNNSRRTSTPMSPGDKRSGTLASGDDSDGFLISTQTATPMRVTLDVGEAAGLEYAFDPVTGEDFHPDVKAGGTYVMERRFEAGESMINLKRDREDASYTLSIEAIDRGDFASRIDREPNNSPHAAGALPLDGRVTGDFDDFGEWAQHYGPYDMYRLPDSWAARSLIVTGDAGGADLEIVNSASDELQDISVAAERTGDGPGKLPGRTPVYLRIDDGSSPYDLTIWPAGETPPDPGTAELSVEISVDDDTLPLAAHWPAPQPIAGQLEIGNASDEPANARINLRTSFVGTRLSPELRPVEIAAGESRKVAFQAALPANLPARRPVSIVADISGAGRTAVDLEIPVKAGVVPRAVSKDRGIPPSMLGGVNVAASATGGEMLPEETADKDREDLPMLIDGMVGGHSQIEAWIGRGTREPTVAVSFDKAPVVGVVLYPHPSQVRRYPASAPSHAVVETRSGDEWDEAWRGDLATGLNEIVIAFEQPVESDAVRVRMRNYGAQTLRLSELKVIASPDHDPTRGEGYEIADFDRGGEMLGGVPPVEHGTSLIMRDYDEVALLGEWPDSTAGFITAFRFHRRAEIARIDWTPAEDNSRRRPAIDTLHVQASADRYGGPWKDLGSLTRENRKLVFERPAAARYLRFVPDAGDGDPSKAWDVRIATQIRVFERAPGNGYTSVLGYYGHGEPRKAPDLPEPTEQNSGNNELETNSPLFGTVERGETAREYSMTVPEDMNRIVLAFNPDYPMLPQVLLDPDADDGETPLTAPGGAQAAKIRDEFGIPDGHVLRIGNAAPGAHRLRFKEPRRSLLVTWDTSPSIGSFRPAVLRALDMISAEIDPEMDAIGLLPFGRESLLGRDWLSDRSRVRTLLRSVSVSDSSSATDSILAGLQMLETRPGARGLLTVTDMDDPSIDYRTSLPYDLIEETSTLVFAGQINGGGLSSGWSQFGERRRLRGFTRASGGSFSEVVNPTQIVDLFETAMGRLRGPKPYEVTAHVYNQVPPPPGKLAVRLAAESAGNDATINLNPVEIVLDASGSMLQRLPDGRRRIVGAKEAIRELVTNALPPATPVALRVFGHLEPDSCDTRLVHPLAPVSDGGLLQKLDKIQAKNLAKTPIAESLRLTAKDLETAEGDPLVVLLTDGDETCEGDPAATLEDLRSAGFDLKVNIIGFAVGAELDATFQSWAEAGRGTYYKADDANSLSEALETAVRPKFEVMDSTGTVVTTASPGGEAIELPVGRYSIVFPGGQARSVDISSGQTSTLEVSVGQ